MPTAGVAPELTGVLSPRRLPKPEPLSLTMSTVMLRLRFIRNVIPPDWSPVRPGEDIGRELFHLVVRAREAGLDPETELRAAARRYRDLVRGWQLS